MRHAAPITSSMILTYKYRLKDKSASKALARHAFAVNQVWNYCNSLQRDIQARWRLGTSPKWPSHFDLTALTKGTSKELQIHGQTVQCVCSQFAKSRDEAGLALRFRSSYGSRRSLGWVPFQAQSRQLDGNCITYLGRRFRWFGSKRRPLPETVRGGAFVEDARGHWYVCFNVEVGELPTGDGEIGIDLGLKTLATCSDGQKFDAIQPYRKLERKLAITQRAGKRQQVRAIHAKIKNIRQDYLHKASAKLARENRFTAVGNVNASQLARTKMSKSVLDASWSTLRNMLRYKASRHGATYLEVDESFTTQTCSSCGALPPERPRGIAGLGMRDWRCSSCGASHDRDVNAARNILKLGQSALPRVDESRRAA